MPQSLHQVYGHIVYSTKDRRPLIDGEMEPRLHSYLAGIVRDLGREAILIIGMPDHVHLLFRASKSVADQDFIRDLKGSSSKWMSEQGVKEFAWQKGYGWFSVSAKDLPVARRYVEEQKSHHAKVSFQDEFRKFLVKYKIGFDERYLWD